MAEKKRVVEEITEEVADATLADVIDEEAVAEETAVDEANEAGDEEATQAEEPVDGNVEGASADKEDISPETFYEETLLVSAFERRSITLPGKKKLKQVFKEAEEIIGDDEGEIETFASQKKREYEILADSAKSQKPKVLYGRVDGIEEIGEGDRKLVMAVCHLAAEKRTDLNTEREITSNIYKILIPAPFFCIYNHEKFDTPEGYDSLKVMMEMRIKQIVEFVVYDVNPAEEVVMASSVVAKQILSYDWYLGKKARIKPGVIAKGHITYINSSGVVVDVFGAEVFIKNSDLRWGYVNSPLDEKENFYIGKSVPVRINEVSTDSFEYLGKRHPFVKIQGTIKEATPNPNEIYFEKYQLGQKYHGVIAYHLETGEYIVRLGAERNGINGDGVTCICKAPAIEFGASPYVGQEVHVVILGKYPDGFRFRGAFTYMDRG